MMNNFQAALKLLDPKQAKFLDYQIMPLFVQESYLNCYGGFNSGPDELSKIAAAAEFISFAD